LITTTTKKTKKKIAVLGRHRKLRRRNVTLFFQHCTLGETTILNVISYSWNTHTLSLSLSRRQETNSARNYSWNVALDERDTKFWNVIIPGTHSTP
jgi:hypothetical protein